MRPAVAAALLLSAVALREGGQRHKKKQVSPLTPVNRDSGQAQSRKDAKGSKGEETARPQDSAVLRVLCAGDVSRRKEENMSPHLGVGANEIDYPHTVKRIISGLPGWKPRK